MKAGLQEGRLPSETASGGVRRYGEVRAMTERLAAPLSPEDQMVQSCFEASPVKWHRAHTTWFFETFLLAEHLAGYRVFHPRFRELYNSYYNQVGVPPERSARGLMSRPSAEEVAAYRGHVDRHMQHLLAEGVAPELAALLELGLNHEQQHQELILTDIQHAFWRNPLRPAYQPPQPRTGMVAAPLEWMEQPGGLCEIGHDGRGFAFDNESPRHSVYLEAYSLASRLVSNGEYQEFIADGGYRRPALWLSDGWEAVRTQGWQAPLYWEQREGLWWRMTLQGMQQVDAAEPVCHVSYYEADAYARWRGARLPSEAEWESVAAKLPLQGNFLDGGRHHPRPAAAGEAPAQMFGDCWEWTGSAYLGYPGYRPPQGAVGEYNGKFMCNQFVLRGGSCATPAGHIRSSYRNFFPPQARWQFSGIRMAR
jgi:ergothioneine biosynthesis protein EgtB